MVSTWLTIIIIIIKNVYKKEISNSRQRDIYRFLFVAPQITVVVSLPTRRTASVHDVSFFQIVRVSHIPPPGMRISCAETACGQSVKTN